MTSREKAKGAAFVAVTIGDLANAGLGISIHCRDCGHFSQRPAANLRIKAERSIPSLERAFVCGLCGSRNSCAMPHYPKRLPER